ncbi:MAG: 2,3-bisphosphoglycerate-independent phosphoglycerate mutase [Candidatus Ratteibacteria bacterium]
MIIETILPEIIIRNSAKILLLVMDGLGGAPDPSTGKTELETANAPNLDAFAHRSTCGLTIPIFPGVTPGSGPAHLALFGYDPVEHKIGRGVLEVLGIGMPLGKDDLAIRGNFATIDEKGIVIDRRAGRIPTEENAALIKIISQKIGKIEGIEISLRTVKEHRCAIVLKGPGLSPEVTENDPQKEGLAINAISPLSDQAVFTAQVLTEFLTRVQEILASIEGKAKTILLRGFAKLPTIATFQEKYKLNAACIASYPMYKGLASLVGMEIAQGLETIDDEITWLAKHYDQFDFFYLHYKKTDSSGEDGDFQKKVAAIEEFNSKFPQIASLGFDAVALTGDHSTPAVMKGHSWHPVPFALYSPSGIPDDVESFTERSCGKGLFSTFPATHAMYLLLAHARKLQKFGA